MKRVVWTILLFCFSLSLSGTVWSQAIMHPDEETLRRWMDDYENAPKAYIDGVIHHRLAEGDALGAGTSMNLLGYIQYTPSQRNQGNCGDCWVWAGTGLMEVALNVQNGIKDQLSPQFLNSCKTDKFPCCGGWLTDLATWYAGKGYTVPWSNSNASYQDASTDCAKKSSSVSCGNISTIPNYPITHIQSVTIPTQGVGQAKAIGNIKNVLQQDKAIFYVFFLPNKPAWDAFRNTWNNSNESALWYPDSYCGQKVVSKELGGHAVVIVGYNDEDPSASNHYWIVLNSWGTATGNRPNGVFRVPMYINYDCTFPNGSTNVLAHQFMTLDIAFNPAPPPAGKPNLVPYLPSGWSDKIVVSNVTGSTTDSGPLSTADTLYVNFAVLNNSTVDINSQFYAALYVDGGLRTSWYWNSLAANHYGYVTDYPIGTLSAGTHTIKVVADSTGSINESYESDNEYTKTIMVQAQSTQKPNLVPYQPSGWSDKIVVSNVTGTTTDKSSFKTTDTLYVDWAVINDSFVNISNLFYISLYVDGVFKNSWYCSSLDADYYTYVADYAIGTLGAGSHTISIVADANLDVAESNETDNTYSKTITVTVDNPSQQLPNLMPYQPKDWSSTVVVSSSKGNTTDSSTITSEDFLYLDWAVLNNGAVATPGGFWVDLYVDGFLENYWSRSSGLKSNYYWSVKDYPLGYFSAGDHLIELVGDSLNQVSESNENDNYYSKWITVKGFFFYEMFPNLRPYQPEGWLDRMVIYTSTKSFTDISSFTSKDPLYVNWAVINDGVVGTSKPFLVTLSLDGVLKKNWKIRSLKANESYVIKNYSIGKLSGGVHTFTIVVDPDGVIREEDKTDNEYSVTIEVLGSP